MTMMFQGASSFNRNVGDWNVSSVTHMYRIFRQASSFNQDISEWNASSATNMSNMFYNADSISTDNKGRIHEFFSFNPNWPYDWSDLVVNFPPDQIALDKIFVMENGKILETGTHAELIARSGAYAKLYAMQFADDEGDEPAAVAQV